MTAATDTIRTVTVVAGRASAACATDTVRTGEYHSDAGLLAGSPGVFVADNGGHSGLKTVGIRGMGSQHTTIYVDGVRVGNVQSGQGDLGVLGLLNFSEAVTDYACGSLSFNTARPSFAADRRLSGSARLSAGSFGTYAPAARVDWKASDRLSVSAGADALFSKGDYPFGDGQLRTGGDISRARAFLDFFGTGTDSDWHAKLWFHGSDRGVPGSVYFPSSDRQKDGNMFAQCLLRKQFSHLYHLTASAKYAMDGISYYGSFDGSRYVQREIQLNSIHRFHIADWLTLGAEADFCRDALSSTVYSQRRLGTTQIASAYLGFPRFRAELSLRYDLVSDKGRKGLSCLSSSAEAGYSLAQGTDLVAFVRRSFRAPTFNELYYVGFGNPDLRPEDALMSGIGARWKRTSGPWTVRTDADLFLNSLRDKITSAPSAEDPNVWQPFNIGIVRCAGADARASAGYSSGGVSASFCARYVFLDATDRTPGSEGEQIPYVSRHSLTLIADAAAGGWHARAVWNLRAGRRDFYGAMPDWNTLDLSIKKTLRKGTTSMGLFLANILDCRYEITGGYPMPGLSINGTIEHKF